MNPANTRVLWATPFNPRPLEPGTMMRLELDQKVDDWRGPHVVGQAEMLKDGVLKLEITTITSAGRVAAALVAEDMIDVVFHGSKPIVRLKVQ